MMKSKIIFTTLLIEKSPQAIPLGAACVASAVKNSPLTKDLCDVELLAFNIEDFENLWKQKLEKIDCQNQNDFSDASNDESFDYFCADLISEKLLAEKPEIVGFSVFVWNSRILQIVSRNLRNHGVFTFAGGPEITSHPQVFDAFDKTVCGEGEAKVPAVIYEKITGQKTEACRIDYDNLSSCYLDGTLNVCDYEGALWELARGCPFKCSYCYESKGEKSVRKFPMERIEKELDLFAQKKVPQVFVLDPTYNADKSRAIQLLKMIAKKTPNTFYYFEARAEFIDRELASYFAKIPCALQIGLQTADENVARLVNRPFNLKNFTKKIGVLNETGIVFGLDVIYGLPGDTFASFKNSVNYAVSLYPNNLEIFCLSVLPGTTLFDEAEKLHLTFETEPPYHVLHTDRFSADDLQNARKIAEGCNIFYNEGRSVPWFNTICHTLKIKPAIFFEKFYNFLNLSGKTYELNCKNHYNHKYIEELQKKFVKEQFAQKNILRLYNAAQDLISYHGAVSRKTDTGKSETIFLHYPPEFLDSEYAFDLDFFVKNVKPKSVQFKS